MSGAPIPLHYDFETIELPRDPVTGKKYDILYMGQRINTSLLVHKKFANLEMSSRRDAPADWSQKMAEPDASYHYKFPLTLAYMLPHQYDAEREFTGMNPKLNTTKELQFDSSFESGNLDLALKVKPYEYDLFMRVATNT